MRLVAARLIYVMIVFGVGFLLGLIRVLVLEPMAGPTFAVACEVSVLVAVMIPVARWLPARLELPLKVSMLVSMGLGALLLQQLADFAVGIYLRNLSATQIVATYFIPAGAIYALSLAAFAAMPVVANWRRLARIV